jgi:hypothetical protein
VADIDGSLATLIKKLRRLGPPSLAALVGQLAGVEDYAEFVRIVRELLPEREGDILGELTPDAQVARFASYFEDRYFPLHGFLQSGDTEGYIDLTRGMPCMVDGMVYEGYHDLAENGRPGLQLMAYLVEAPYGETEARIPLAEVCKEHVPVEDLQQVPPGGLKQDECRQLLGSTQYQALAHWSDMMGGDTHNFFLDVCDEDLYSGMELPDWSKETVEELTQQWHQADAIWKEVIDLATWLEVDPPARFKEILNFILERRLEAPPESI